MGALKSIMTAIVTRTVVADYPERIDLKVKDGVVIVAGDQHYQVGPPSVMHRALIHFCQQEKPKAFICNGDVLDLSSISRHPRIGWQQEEEVSRELEVSQQRMAEIEQAVGKSPKTWNRGNHDDRFETYLSGKAPRIQGIPGTRLADHFPKWQITTSTWINDDVVVKHRFRGGKYAPLNNTEKAGKSIVTGHLHSAMVAPFDDYNGTRYGVDHGCISEVNSSFFKYTEGNPLNWRSAFCILTFVKGKLLMPELVLRVDGKTVQFRGRLVTV